MLLRKGKKGWALILGLMAFGIVGLAGCSTGDKSSEEKVESAQSIVVEHELGEAEVNKNPEKVIVFDYATLDSLNKMEVEVIGLPKSNLPSYLESYSDEKYEDVGTLFEPDFEKIFELDPDLILISGRQQELYSEFAEIAPTVFLTVDNQDYIGSLSKNLNTLGEIFGKEEFVGKEIESINDRISELKNKVEESGKNALVIMANDGALNAYGNNSRFGVIHKEFGFPAADENIEVSKHGQNVSFEYILELNPDIVFVIDRGAVAGGSVAAENVMENDIVKMTDAYKNGDINYLNSHIWYVSSGGIESTGTMIDEALKAIEKN